MMYCLVWQPFDPDSKHPVYISTPPLIGGTPTRDGATTGVSTPWCSVRDATSAGPGIIAKWISDSAAAIASVTLACRLQTNSMASTSGISTFGESCGSSFFSSGSGAGLS